MHPVSLEPLAYKNKKTTPPPRCYVDDLQILNEGNLQ